MKKIEAIIRKTKFQDVKDTLHDSGIDFFSFFPVTGVGKATQSRVYRGIAYDTSSIGRLLLTIVVRDVNLEKTVNAILIAAKTGELGDGKIFISDINESYRIRNGEKGDESLFVKD